MFCKYCGNKIADDSKFCQHCGRDLCITYDSTNKVGPDSKKGSSKDKVIEIPTIKTNISDKTKRLIFAYGIWFVFNLYWLFAGEKSMYATSNFQPFTDEPWNEYSYYDITEFIVYIIGVPLAIWGFILYRNIFRERRSVLIKFVKKYGISFFALVMIVFTISIFISRCSKDNDDYASDYYQPSNTQIQKSVHTQDNYNYEEKEHDFNSQIEDINKQIKATQQFLMEKRINDLPSEYDY